MAERKPVLTFEPLTQRLWKDFEKLFGERGACGGCWCMTWRFNAAQYEKNKGIGNRNSMKKLVENHEPVGIIAYVNGEPAGWCAAAPRDKYVRLENSRVLKRIDNKPVWSITCFFIAKPFRRQGLSVELISGAVSFCRSQRAACIEAYPIEPADKKMPDVFAWTGFASAFVKAGFKEAARNSPTRPIMRLDLKSNS